MPKTSSDPLDDTDHGPVPNLQPDPVVPEPGRAPIPDPAGPGDTVELPPDRAPFPDDIQEAPLPPV